MFRVNRIIIYEKEKLKKNKTEKHLNQFFHECSRRMKNSNNNGNIIISIVDNKSSENVFVIWNASLLLQEHKCNNTGRVL